jgi:hypothetical protein
MYKKMSIEDCKRYDDPDNAKRIKNMYRKNALEAYYRLTKIKDINACRFLRSYQGEYSTREEFIDKYDDARYCLSRECEYIKLPGWLRYNTVIDYEESWQELQDYIYSGCLSRRLKEYDTHYFIIDVDSDDSDDSEDLENLDDSIQLLIQDTDHLNDPIQDTDSDVD